MAELEVDRSERYMGKRVTLEEESRYIPIAKKIQYEQKKSRRKIYINPHTKKIQKNIIM